MKPEPTRSRGPWRSTWLGAVLLYVGLAAGCASPRTNFVIMLCDDLGYGDLSCYGHPTIRTPNLDRLATEGARLTDCYASAPVCSPSRAGLLTGRTPYRCGIEDWIPENHPMHLRRSEITVATLLRDAGYATCHVGKWHCNGAFNSPEQPQPGDHGFEYWFSTQNNAIPSHRDPINFVRNGQAVGPTQGYASRLIVDQAIDWLNRRDRGRPFCLFVWFHTPHEPVATSQPFVDLYSQATPEQRREYYGNVSQMDHEVGRLMGTLDALGLRDRTFVMFSSDNGPETLNRYRGAERSYGSPGPLRGMKLHLYEGGIRVPGIVRWPGNATPASVSAQPVCNTDVLPTLCEIAGVRVPADRAIDGASMVPMFSGRPIRRSTPLYWRYDRAIGRPKQALREGDWKLLADADLRQFELYNLREDPGETIDRAADRPDRVETMSAKLRKLHDQIDAERPRWPTVKKPDRQKK